MVKTHETRDPYKIAKEQGIFIVEEDLGEVYGYYNASKRRKFVHINRNLSGCEKRFTCSHELGHAICHPDEATPALSRSNLVSELKIEKEANYFATKLIIDDSHEQYYINSSYDVLDLYGLPYSFERFL